MIECSVGLDREGYCMLTAVRTAIKYTQVIRAEDLPSRQVNSTQRQLAGRETVLPSSFAALGTGQMQGLPKEIVAVPWTVT